MRWLNLTLAAAVGFTAGWLAFHKDAAPDTRKAQRVDDSHLVLRVAELEAEVQRLLLAPKPPEPKAAPVKTPSTSPIEKPAPTAQVVHDPTTAVGREALLKEGHQHRNKGRHEAAAQSYERARMAVGPHEVAWVEATFQLAWTASFAGDTEKAVRLFQDAMQAPGANEKFKAFCFYNIAVIHEDDDPDLAFAEYEAVVRDFGESKNGMVRHYAKLAKDAVERLRK